jgi:pimeloyl-ACP methyl ester carboxylesterase
MGSARGITHRWVDVGGLHLHCVEAGTGPLVVLLHRFPEFWYAWRHQLPALADADYRVVAPDLPGYNTSDKPPRVRDYQPRVLAQEVADLIVALGAASATVAGHDWGGGLAWLLAMHHPERVQRLVLLNAPHPIRFLKGLRSPRQLRRSWYMLAFQAPWLPERLVAARDFRALRRAPAPPTDPAGRLDPPGHRPLRGRGQVRAGRPGAGGQVVHGPHYHRAPVSRVRYRRKAPGVIHVRAGCPPCSHRSVSQKPAPFCGRPAFHVGRQTRSTAG